jgi:hypothetical protein
VKAEYLEVIREAQEEASEQFARYRAEVGLPGRKDARKPA